eukprot:g68622.t1
MNSMYTFMSSFLTSPQDYETGLPLRSCFFLHEGVYAINYCGILTTHQDVIKELKFPLKMVQRFIAESHFETFACSFCTNMAEKCDLVPSGEESILLGATLSELAQREAFSKWFLTSAKRNTKIEDAMMFILEKVLQNLGVLEAAADSSATQSPAAAAGPAEDQACIKLQSAEQSELPQVAAAGTCNT